MAFSYILYQADGVNQTFTVPFNYLQKAHITVRRNDVPVAVAWPSAGQVTVAELLSVGDEIEVRRNTPTAPLVVANDTSVLTASQINTFIRQSLYVSEEALDLSVANAREEVVPEAPQTFEVDYVATANINVNAPPLSSGGVGPWILDGDAVFDGARVLCVGNNIKKGNRIFEYDLAANVLRPASIMPDTMVIVGGKTFVSVLYGETNAESTWVLSVAGSAIVGTVDLSWLPTDSMTGAQFNGMFLAGPARPTNRPAFPTYRALMPEDLPRYRVARKLTLIPQSIYVNLNNFGYTSRHLSSTTPFANRDQINYLINEYRTVIFDSACYLNSQVTASLKNKHLVFMGTGWDGPNRIYMNTAGSFLDVGGSVNLRTEGMMVVEFMPAQTATTKAIRATSTFTNLQMERVWVKGAPFGVFFDAANCSYDIDTIRTDNIALEVPFTDANPTNVANKNLRRVENHADVGINTTNAAMTWRAFTQPKTIYHTATLTTNRVVTLHTDNVVDGYELMVVRTGVDAFTLRIGGLKLLATNTWCRVRYVSALSAWTLVAYGTL